MESRYANDLASVPARFGLCLSVLGLVVGLAGCSGAPERSTRLSGDDLEQVSRKMAARFAGSDVLASRGPDSPEWVVAISKVLNLTSDVMTESEQWAVIAKLRSSLSITALRDQKNIRFVIPVERTRAIRQEGGADGNPGLIPGAEFGSQRRPTHAMSATFRSITRANEVHRTELYALEFQIMDLHSGEPVWSDRFEFKRSAVGHVWD